MKFAKLQATGNDFIVIEADAGQGFSLAGEKWGKLAQAMCHRYLGIGGDGLIMVIPSSVADVGIRIFNSDGSEAEVCGNGLRCLVKYVVDRGKVNKLSLTVETVSGIRQVETFAERGKVIGARVNMGIPWFQPEDIPLRLELLKKGKGKINVPILDYPVSLAGRKLALSLVSMGNPHAVSFLSNSVADFPLAEIGPRVETHSLFPQRTNFEVARVVEQGRIEARVWERGVGETLSCGSGACAIAVISRLKGYTKDKVDIMLPGGILTIDWDGVGEIWLTGAVEEVFTGEWHK